MIKYNRIIGIICAAFNMLPWLIFTAYCMYVLCFPSAILHFETQGYSYVYLFYISPCILASTLGAWGSLLLHKKPILGAVLMLVSGAFVFLVAPFWWLKILSLFLIAAGVLALISTGKTSVSLPRNENPESTGSNQRGCSSC